MVGRAGTASGRATRPQATARWSTVAVGALCSIVAWFAVGADGAVSAALATVIVVGFFWSGTIPVVLTDRARLGPAGGLAVLLLTYTLRLAVVLLVLRLLSRVEFVDRSWLGGTIIACALTWTAVHVGASRSTGQSLREMPGGSRNL
jgi:ATP synthase protein I